MLSQIDHCLQQNTNFKKGMTLNEYLAQMQTLSTDQKMEQKIQQDLYATSRRNQPSHSRKIITYQIRESQQDDYEQSHEQKNCENMQNKQSIRFTKKEQRSSNKNILINFPGAQVKSSIQNNKGFRVRRQSNSPFNHHKKQLSSLSPNKNFAMTLFHGDWKNQVQSTSLGNPSTTTLYGKFLKGVKEVQSNKPKHHQSKQKYFQKKNHQQIQYLLKYEKDIQQKYNKYSYIQSVQMRVQGVTDRLHDRKILNLKTHK